MQSMTMSPVVDDTLTDVLAADALVFVTGVPAGVVWSTPVNDIDATAPYALPENVTATVAELVGGATMQYRAALCHAANVAVPINVIGVPPHVIEDTVIVSVENANATTPSRSEPDAV